MYSVSSVSCYYTLYTAMNVGACNNCQLLSSVGLTLLMPIDFQQLSFPPRSWIFRSIFLCRCTLFTGKGVGVGAHHGVRPPVWNSEPYDRLSQFRMSVTAKQLERPAEIHALITWTRWAPLRIQQYCTAVLRRSRSGMRLRGFSIECSNKMAAARKF